MLSSLKRYLIRSLESRGYYVSFGEPATLDAIFSTLHRRTPNLFFVQIGAFDGLTDDPLASYVHRYRWRGMLVEPQREAFEALQRNYAACEGLILENVAIGNSNDVLTLYRLKEECAHLFGRDRRLIASSSVEHVVRHLAADVHADEALERVDVPCTTLPNLLAKHHIDKIDLLQVDAEAADASILRSLDLDSIHPAIIRFEYVNLDAESVLASVELLRARNYKLIVGAVDITACRSNCMYA